MNKQEFLAALARELEPLPREERYQTLGYYDELIDDRLEDGQDEGAVIQSLGDPKAVAEELLGEEEQPLAPNRGLRVWLIVLLVLGFPLWGSLLVAAAVVLLCVFLCLYIPAFVLGVLALSFLAGAVLGVAGTPFLIADIGLAAGGLGAGLFQLGLAVGMLGLAALCAVGFWYTGKATAKAGKVIWRWLKRSVGKGRRRTA